MGNAFGAGSYGMNFCLPRLDQALSALLSDLKQRGLLEDTLVVAVGEFGRTPKVNPNGAPRCWMVRVVMRWKTFGVTMWVGYTLHEGHGATTSQKDHARTTAPRSL